MQIGPPNNGSGVARVMQQVRLLLIDCTVPQAQF